MKKSFIAALFVIVSVLTNMTTVNAFDFKKLKNEIKTELKNELKVVIKEEFNKLMNESSVEKVEVSYNTLEFVNFDQPRVDYAPLDELNRAGQATAYLTKANVTKTSSERGSQRFLPTGFVKQAKIWDRGHLIAYSLTYQLNDNGEFERGHDGSLDNPRNLFTQTAQSNRGEMKSIENEVRKVLKTGEKVIYRVTPHFENDELVARYALVEAVSEYGTLNINEVVENVQDGKTIDYATGRVK